MGGVQPKKVTQGDIEKYLPLLDEWIARMSADPLEMLDVINAANRIRNFQMRMAEIRKAKGEAIQTQTTSEPVPS